MFLKRIALAGSMATFAASAGYACEIDSRVNIVGNEFAAIQAVAASAGVGWIFARLLDARLQRTATEAAVTEMAHRRLRRHCPSRAPVGLRLALVLWFERS